MQTNCLAIGVRKDEPGARRAWVDDWVKTNLQNGKLGAIYRVARCMSSALPVDGLCASCDEIYAASSDRGELSADERRRLFAACDPTVRHGALPA